MVSRLLKANGLMIWLPVLLLFALSAYGEDGAPKITKKKFESFPQVVRYFDDTDVILILEKSGQLWRSEDGGVEWKTVEDVKKKGVREFWINPYHNQWAYALGTDDKHWVTSDKGESWKEFELGRDESPTLFRHPLSFHSGDAEKVILKAQKCGRSSCEEFSYYTTNGFKDVKPLRKQSKECLWLAGTPEAKSSKDNKKDDQRIICVIQGDNDGFTEENRIVTTGDYFKDSVEPITHENRKVKGFINVAAVKAYMIAAAKSEGSSELSLMISTDGEAWHQAQFPSDHKIHEEAYTIMESTNYSVQVDVAVKNPWDRVGVLFTSDSNGTYFTESIRHTNRNSLGLVDFEKVQGIQGIVLVNLVKNWKEVEKDSRKPKELFSQISFDDGRVWKPLKTKDGKTIHLHSVTDISNLGRIFSSPPPGLIMGVGNTGDSLAPYKEGDLWVSDDAGLTWIKGLSEAHKYEFGDQGTILVAVYDEGATNEIQFSLNHGKDWKSAKLGDEKVRAGYLTTIPDSTTQKFLLEATGRDGDDPAFYIYTLDFTKVYANKCKEDDFEEWYARLDEDGKPDCLMGHTQKYRRRKKDANCYVGEKFKEALPQSEDCKCTYEDYECDFLYKPEGEGKDKKCVPEGRLEAPKGSCEDGKGTFKGPSGFRRIPGNTCKDGDKLDEDKVDRPCEQPKQPPTADGKVRTTTTMFPGNHFKDKVYIEKSDTAKGDDETIVMSVAELGGDVVGMYQSRNHGQKWERFFDERDNYQYIIKDEYHKDRVFFVSPNSKKIAYSINRMDTIDYFNVDYPMGKSEISPLSFHPDKVDNLIWTGAKGCGKGENDCHNVAFISDDRGGSWKILGRYTNKCKFIGKRGRGQQNDDLIYCEQREDEEPNGRLLLRAKNGLKEDFETKVEDIIAFATMSEFIVVAKKDKETNLKVAASIDGQTFAVAEFPPNFDVPVQTAYTVLDSSTHAIFLHVTESSVERFEYGKLVKSNSNGTFYITALDYVNRDSNSYVDFEKMLVLQGVAMVNVVANPDEHESGKKKKLQSLISHNDGAIWAPMKAPADDGEGGNWSCDVKDTKTCALHVHSFTERDHAKDTFSSSSAIGVMLAVGNVGEELAPITDKEKIYTFISRDAGISWKVAKKGRFMWEYGDQGSLILIVERGLTNYGYYTTDEGESWARFRFHESKISILDLTTIPSDNSKSFLVWFQNGDGEVGTINIDFSATREDRECVEPQDGKENEDYYLWSPKHPSQDTDCLFGKKVQYLRKKPDRNCWNGRKLDRIQGESTPCECTELDFECDYNYVRTVDNVCKLPEGLVPEDHLAACRADPNQKTYYKPEGYRKLRISGCEGGQQEKYLGKEYPCPGHENDPDLPSGSKGLSGFMFFLVGIVLPIAAAGAIGYLIWNRIQNGAGFGRIRLGESRSISALDGDQPWVKYPVAVLSGLVAVVAAVPLLLAAGWRAIAGRFGSGRRYTSRQSFARGRGDYSIVEDEDELLGDDEEDAER